MPTSILDATKIQARIVIPIVKALENELGTKRAHHIVGKAIAQTYVDYRDKLGFEENRHPHDEGQEGSEGPAFPVERQIVEDTDKNFSQNIIKCAFADYFISIGEPEIGALMTCGVDFAAELHMRPSWDFKRTQTRMKGAPFCDFRWEKKEIS